MKKGFLCLILLLSTHGYAESMRDMINELFERQQEMMGKMMDDDIFESFSQSQDIRIDSKIVKENGKNFEVVTIETDGEASQFDIEVDQMIRVTVATTQTQNNQNMSFSSSSSSSQIFPIPQAGKYQPSMTKRTANQASLYFEVPEGKIAGNYGANSMPRSVRQAPEYSEEDKAVVVPQRKI